MKKEFLFSTTDIDELFIDRERELQLLHDAVKDIMDYNGRFIIIRGGVGVGKTSLLDRFIEKIGSRDYYILYGRALKDEARPFSPFVPMIEDYLFKQKNQPGWFGRILKPEIASYFSHLIPKLKEYYPLEIQELDYPVDNHIFFYALQGFFDNLSVSKPLVLVLDDIQWMADDSIILLKYLVRRIVAKSILILATMRDQMDNQGLKMAVDELNNEHSVSYITLSDFSPGEVGLVLNSIFNTNLSGAFARWLFTITRGNPLFIKEIIKTLMYQNIIFYDEAKNQWQIEDDYEDFPVSETIESIIGYRLHKLSDSELKLLQSAAVIGESFSLPILYKLCGLKSRKQFLRSINILSSSGLIKDSEETRTLFIHPLIRALFYKKIDPARRRKLHRKLAVILKKNNAAEEEIAFHLTKDLHPAEETRELAVYLFNIAERLFDNYQYLSAKRYLKVAQGIVDKKGMNKKMALKIKSLSNQLYWLSEKGVLKIDDIGHFAKVCEAHKLKKEAGIHYRMLFHENLALQNLSGAEKYLNKAMTLVKKSESLYWLLRAEHCLLQIRKGLLQNAEDEAMRLIGEIPQDKAPEARYKIFLYLKSIALSKGDLNKALEFILEAVKVVENAHLLLYTGDAYAQLGIVEARLGKMDSALARFYESLKKAELMEKEQLIGVDLLYIGYGFLIKGEYRRAKEFFEKAKIKAEKICNRRLELTARLNMVRVFLELNQIDEAENLLKGINEKELEINARCDYMLYKSALHLKKGEIDDALKFAERAIRFVKGLHFSTRFAEAAAQKAQVLLKKGYYNKSLKLFKKAKEILSSNGEKMLLAGLLIKFGLALGDENGEAIFLQGLKLLFEMNATPRISKLYKLLEAKKFNNAGRVVRERLKKLQINPIEITTFGGLSVKMPGDIGEIARNEWQSRKSQELLGLMLLRPGGITREILISFLWPDMAKRKSQANFRVLLTRLNKILGKGIILQRGPFLSLNKDMLQVDFWEFEAFVKEWQYLKQRAKLHPAEDRALKATTLYRGDFLPEFYSRPIVDKQFELKEKIRRVLYWLAKRCMERAEWQKAIFFARRLLSFDVNDEQACQIIMESFYNQGNRISAIRQFQRLKRGLKEEFNTTPSVQTISLYKRILGKK